MNGLLTGKGSWRYLVVVSLAFLAVSLVSVSWARDISTTRVTVLGGGTRAGLFITAGQARMLVVDGSDTAAFGNALAAARHPGLDRIDVLLVTGADTTFSLAARTLENTPARTVLGAGPLVSNPRLPWPDSMLDASGLQISLAPDFIVQVDTVPGKNELAEQWRILIQHDGIVIALLSDAGAAPEFTWDQPVSLMILQRGDPGELAGYVRTDAIVVPGSEMKSYEVQAWLEANEGTQHLLRVFPGETGTLEFTPDGLVLPVETRSG